MAVGTLEEVIDDNHAIVSTSVGSEHYVSILSFVDKDSLEPGCTVLLNHKVIQHNFYNYNYILMQIITKLQMKNFRFTLSLVFWMMMLTRW